MASQGDPETRTLVLVQFISNDQDVLEARARLLELLYEIGPVENANQMKVWNSEYHCFVKFCQPQDAQTAVDQLDKCEIQGTTLRVSFAANYEVAVAQRQTVADDRTKLIVNYLPLSMTQREMLALFSPFGELRECKLMLDSHTGESLAYGFVKYYRPEDAAGAIDALNGLRVQNKTVKVSYAASGSKHIKDANLYVSNLPTYLTQEDVLRLFRTYGQVLSCRLLCYNLDGDHYVYGSAGQPLASSKGLAFVLYDKRYQAEMAIKWLNKSFLGGNILNVQFAKAFITAQLLPSQPQPPIHQPQMLQHPENCRLNMVHFPVYQKSLLSYSWRVIQWWTLFVYGLGQQANEALLLQQFTRFGSVQHVKIIYNKKTNEKKPYGFVDMINYVEALNAVENLNGVVFQGHSLQVRFSSCYCVELPADEN